MTKQHFRCRIAFSSICGVICLLTIAWWARSYWWMDGGFVKLCPWAHVQFSGGDGRMCIRFERKPINVWFSWSARRITEPTPPDAENRIPWFDLAFWPTFARLYTAHWFLAVLAGSLALAPWCPSRFSLRMLLGATTVTAAITGLIVWIDRTI